MLRLMAALCVFLLITASVACEEESTKKAPAFSLKDLSNKDVALEDLLGKGPVLIDFWATWCKPCIASLDHTREIYKELKGKGLEVVAINTDDPRNVPKVKPMASSHRWNFIILLDTNKDVKRLYHVSGYPTTFLLDREGNVRYRHVGYVPGSEKDLKREIEELLAAAESEADTSADEDEVAPETEEVDDLEDVDREEETPAAEEGDTD
jgi:peroxiredoxin